VNAGALPMALQLLALVFALAFAPQKAVMPALFLMSLVAAVAFACPVTGKWETVLFLGSWAGLVLVVLTVHLPAGPTQAVSLILGANTGLWVGTIAAASDMPSDVMKVLPLALLVLPARWLVAHRGGIAIKVAASWLIAVAILCATLPIVPTPGYVADHME
jgi:hypothetical protein